MLRPTFISPVVMAVKKRKTLKIALDSKRTNQRDTQKQISDAKHRSFN